MATVTHFGPKSQFYLSPKGVTSREGGFGAKPPFLRPSILRQLRTLCPNRLGATSQAPPPSTFLAQASCQALPSLPQASLRQPQPPQASPRPSQASSPGGPRPPQVFQASPKPPKASPGLPKPPSLSKSPQAVTWLGLSCRLLLLESMSLPGEAPD